MENEKRSFEMRVVCCVCGEQYETKQVEKPTVLVSHGVCTSCEPELRRQFGLKPKPA